jgi:hypothetical protein
MLEFGSSPGAPRACCCALAAQDVRAYGTDGSHVTLVGIGDRRSFIGASDHSAQLSKCPLRAAPRARAAVFVSSSASARSTAGLFVNWIWSYCTTWSRLPNGSRASRRGPGLDLGAGLLQGLARRLLVVDDEAEVHLRLRRTALREREELVAQVDERHSRLALVDPELAEDRAPEGERALGVVHAERDVVNPDEAGSRCRHESGNVGTFGNVPALGVHRNVARAAQPRARASP